MINDKIKKMIESKLSVGKDARRPIERNWKKLIEYYHLKSSTTSIKYFTALLANYSDSIRARWIASIFSGRDFFGLRGRNFTGDPNAKFMEDVCKYQIEEQADLIMKIKRLFVPLSYLGNQIGSIQWDESKMTPTYKGISLFDCWLDPDGDGIQNTSWVITREYIPYAKLLKLQSEGLVMDVEKIKDMSSTRRRDSEAGYGILQSSVGIKSQGAKIDEQDPNDKPIEIYQYWTNEMSVAIELKSGHIITKPASMKPSGVMPEFPNPYGNRQYLKKPFLMVRCCPEEGLPYGRSPVDRLISLQEELNEHRHEYRKKEDLIVKGIWMSLRGCAKDLDRLKKDAILVASDISDNSFRHLEIPNILPQMEEAEERLLRYADRCTNIYDPQRGGTSGQVTKTARGLDLLIREGNLLRQEEIANIQTEFIKELIGHWILLNQENIEEEMQINQRVSGQLQTSRITPENLTGNFDIVITSSPAFADKDSQAIKVANFQTKFAGTPYVRDDVLVRKEAELAGLDPDEVMTNKEEYNIKVENQQLKQALEQAQQQLQHITKNMPVAAATPEKKMV